MARIGHSSARAALLYQHATRERDDAIAVALDAMARPGRADERVLDCRTARCGGSRTLWPMSVQHHVDAEGRYDGKTLQELWPAVVDEVVAAVDPLEVILFGSVARGEDGPDSDIDLLVVLDHIEAGREAADDGAHPLGDRHVRAGRRVRHRPGRDGGASRRRRLVALLAAA